jgi:UDP-GlcNAc:undecaprenyl-phosphate GlcNAc-1-phosphate transferase
MITVLFINNRIGEIFRKSQGQILTMLVSGTFIFVIGLIDDLYNLKARNKLLAQIVAASAIYFAGIKIVSLNFANLFTVDFGALSFPATIFWVLAITNAVNLIDGLDGLAAGIAAVACAVIAIFAFERDLILMTVLMLSLLGSLTGFLFYNFNPARIFMGDCGSMFLGFILAASSMRCAAKTGTAVVLALVTLALGLPIFDTFFSIVRRYLNRRGIMSPDRNHLHHKLLDLGLQHRHVVIIMYVLTLSAAGAGMFMMLAQGLSVLVIFLSVLLLLVLVFRAFGAVRFREIMNTWKRKHTVSHQVQYEKEEFETIELYFHRAKLFDQWWDAICFAADRMGFLRGRLPITNRDGTERILIWHRCPPDDMADNLDIVAVSLPIRDRRAGLSLKLDVEVMTNGSVESAGRRLALFSRLIEDYGIVNLPSNPKGHLKAESFKGQNAGAAL